ncbi:MAG: serine/threonine protein kinase, partial [Calditrichaeota bacterium]
MQSIPEQIGHYTILQRIAQGGMGEVYLAHDTHLNRKVALKFISHTLLANQDARERFLREARAAALLNHPNIVTIYDIDDAGGFTYIAMEYVEGVSLKKYIAEKEEGLPPVKALEIAMQIAAGLGAAHAAGVIHRDIKSDNILIDQKGRVKILDFGLAKFMTDRQLTQTMTQMGT